MQSCSPAGTSRPSTGSLSSAVTGKPSVGGPSGARTSSVAHRMFAESQRVLRPDGTITVVANRHLGHHATLRRWFDDVDVVGSDPRFVVLRGRRRQR